MIISCVNCGSPISTYPCKFCGMQRDIIEDLCPRLNGVLCQHTRKVCTKKADYINCDILRKND